MQWGIHHHTTACKCQQKRDSLTPCQGQYQSWRQCVTPPCILMPLSRSDQPTWPTHWPWSCQYQTHCLQQIPYTPYGILRGPITWQPDHPGSQPHRVNSYWYIADTHGPAILSLPSSENLAVMKMNCAITVRWPSTHPAPVSTTVATTKPATAPEAAKSIRSTDDLINKFPDWFKGISRFPGKYKIQLCHDAHPVMHAPRKCPIALCLKVKEHLNKMECLGMITHVGEPMDWVSSITISRRQMTSYICAWIPVTSMRPSAMIITRCPPWRMLLISLHTLASSLS